MNISIDNRYCNRFIHLGRLIFSVNRSGVSVNNPVDIWERACAYRSGYSREAPLTQSATEVRSSLLDSSMLWLFRETIMSPIIIFTSSPTCFAGTNAIGIGLITVKDRIFSTSATSANPPFIFLLWSGQCLRNDQMTLAFHVLQNVCHVIIFITIYSYSWTWYKPMIAIIKSRQAISIRY